MMQWSERTDGANFYITRYDTVGGRRFSFLQKAMAVRREINWLTHRMANMAMDHIENNFKAQGFVDETIHRWPKRRRPASWPILQKTGKLKMIKRQNQSRNSVTLTSAAPYAGVHNRPVGEIKKYGPYNYPGRMFMGHSQVLADATKKMIVTRINMAMQS